MRWTAAASVGPNSHPPSAPALQVSSTMLKTQPAGKTAHPFRTVIRWPVLRRNANAISIFHGMVGPKLASLTVRVSITPMEMQSALRNASVRPDLPGIQTTMSVGSTAPKWTTL